MRENRLGTGLNRSQIECSATISASSCARVFATCLPHRHRKPMKHIRALCLKQFIRACRSALYSFAHYFAETTKPKADMPPRVGRQACVSQIEKKSTEKGALSQFSLSTLPRNSLAAGATRHPRRFSMARSGKPRRSLLPLRLRGIRAAAAAAANSRLHGFTIIGCLRGRRQRRRRRGMQHEAHTGVASPPVEIASAVPHNN